MSKLPHKQKAHPAYNLPEVGNTQPPNGLSLIDPRPNPNAMGEEQDGYNLRS